MAIVGGGISGLYCALKLLEKPDNLEELAIKKIIILEKSDRWGGRLCTDIIKIKETEDRREVVKEEEGAMRFTYPDKDDPNSKTNMPLLADLIKSLQMEDDVVHFYMEPRNEQGNSGTVPNCNSRYFNGKHFTDWYTTQNPDLWKNLFNLERVEEFKSADEIVKDIYRKLLDHNKSKLLFHFPNKALVIFEQKDTELLQEYENQDYWAFFRNDFTWTVGMQEIPLNKFSMQALLTTMKYSHGCIMMMVQTQGFLCVSLSEGNVGSILQDLITFNLIGNKLYQFKKGWSSLVNTIIKKHLKKTNRSDGVKVEMRKSCGVSMICEETKGFKLTFESHKDEYEISAKHVVMAVPPKSVDDITFTFDADERELNGESLDKICRPVEGIHCTKINFYFDNDWWNQTEGTLMYGPNITSLPCGFVYPFYGDCKSKGCKGCDKCDDDPCPAALTVYCDVNNAQYWSSLQKLGHQFQSPLQKGRKNLLPASEPVVDEAIKQFSKVFNIKEIPHPILTSYRSWDGGDRSWNGEERIWDDGDNLATCDYGYAIHMWGVGVDDRKIMKKATQPIKGKNLYFCNEAWSGFQGWVEGSLLSTEKVVNALWKSGKASD